MLKHCGFGFSSFFLILGIVGLIDYLLPDEGLFQSLEVNLPLIFLYFSTALFGFASLLAQLSFTRTYLQIAGILYGALALLGFIYGKTPIFGFFTSNLANSFIHSGVSIFAITSGFGVKDEEHE